MGTRGARVGALSLWLAAAGFLVVDTPAVPIGRVPASPSEVRDAAGVAGPGRRAGGRESCRGDVGWVSTWGSGLTGLALEAPFSAGFDDQTLRQVVHTSVGGSAVRVTLGARPDGPDVEVASASVALPEDPSGDSAAVLPATVTPLTFGGERSVTVPAGGRITSDVVQLDVPEDHDLAVSLWFAQPTGPSSGHMYSGQTSWVGRGNLVGVAGSHRFDRSTTTTEAGEVAYPYAPSFFVTSVDVLGDDLLGGVVLLGDSISDGFGFLWPPDDETVASELLFDRLQAHGRDCLAVANVALAGNSLLPFAYDTDNTGLRRLDRDVLSRPGLRVLVVALGINDLYAGGRSTDEVVLALASIVERAHAADVKVVGATIPPLSDAHSDASASLEMRRQLTNQRIMDRGPGSIGFDAVVDLDAALRDPADARRIQLTYAGCAYGGCGQWHPGLIGHRVVANAFDVDELARLAG